MNTKRHFIIIGLMAVFLGACVTKKYTPPVATLQGNLYRDTTVTDSANLADLPYRQLFTDPLLQTLITEGVNNNLDLKSAVQRLNEAQATLYQSRGAALPNVSASATFTRTKTSAASLNYPAELVSAFPLTANLFQAGLSVSWEADVWGKFSSGRRSALANFLASDAARRAVQTQLVANIATDYYQLLALDQQLRVAQQTLQSRIEEVETLKLLKESAVVNGAAVVQSEANRYAAEVLIPDLKRSIRETENALSILLARAPGSIRRSTLEEQRRTASLQTGVPSQLLRNRPDVQQTEFAFRSAFESTNVARTYFYPQLTITAQGGLSTLQIRNLFDNSIFYNLVGGLTQPIFNQRQNKARLRTAQAQQQEAYYAFQQSMLNAGGEVSNALYAYQTALEKQSGRTRQLQALQKAVEFTRELLRYSSATNYTDVLTSEQSLLAAQLDSVNDRLQELQAVVDLYRALGGGWK